MDCPAAKGYFKVSPERIPPPDPEKVLEASRSVPRLDIIALRAPREDLGAPVSERHSGPASSQTSGADVSIIPLDVSHLFIIPSFSCLFTEAPFGASASGQR